MKRWIIGAVMAAVMMAGGIAGAQEGRGAGASERYVLVRFAVPDAIPQDDREWEFNRLRETLGDMGLVSLNARRWDGGMIISISSGMGGRSPEAEVPQEPLDAAVQKVMSVFQKQTLNDGQRRQQLGEVSRKLEAVRGQMEVLLGISQNHEKFWPGILVEQIKAGELEKQRLKMELAAKEIRSAAIRRQIEQTEKEVAEKLAKDPTSERLKIVIQQAQVDLERLRMLFAKEKAASASEVASAELGVAEAQARLAERREELRQLAKGDLLNRLTGELAVLMIDVAELEGRLKYLEQTLPPLVLKQLSEQQLSQLAQQYKGLYTDQGALPPLYNKLDEEARGLVVKKLSLLASEVRVITAEEAEQISRSVNPRGNN